MNEEALAHWVGCDAKNKGWNDKTDVFGEQHVLGPTRFTTIVGVTSDMLEQVSAYVASLNL
jgi:hypothetical protein